MGKVYVERLLDVMLTKSILIPRNDSIPKENNSKGMQMVVLGKTYEEGQEHDISSNVQGGKRVCRKDSTSWRKQQQQQQQ